MKRLKDQQQGIASIYITLFLIIIISLIVVGFAQVTRREQKQSADRQFSTQAFYAAETGINDAIKVIEANKSSTNSKPKCNNDGASQTFISANLTGQISSSGDSVSYTCLLVNPVPTSLIYDNVNTDNATTVRVKSQSSNINQIKFVWLDTDGGGGFGSCPSSANFPASWPGSGCDAGVLRVDLVPVSGGLGYSSLNTNNFNTYFYPRNGGAAGSVGYSTAEASKGQIIASGCNNGMCEAVITGLNQGEYYARVRSIYKSNKLTVTAQNSSNLSADLTLTDGQLVIDATGKAGDVLRRVSVRYNPNTNIGLGVPSFALVSRDSICKRLVTIPGVNFVSVDTTGLSGDTSACQPD
jgi:Tfp pilus assembly protein PilX